MYPAGQRECHWIVVPTRGDCENPRKQVEHVADVRNERAHELAKLVSSFDCSTLGMTLRCYFQYFVVYQPRLKLDEATSRCSCAILRGRFTE